MKNLAEMPSELRSIQESPLINNFFKIIKNRANNFLKLYMFSKRDSPHFEADK